MSEVAGLAGERIGRSLPVMAGATGALVLAGALLADPLTGRGIGSFGTVQLVGAGVGAILVASGVVLAGLRGPAYRAQVATLMAERGASIADLRSLGVVVVQVLALALLVNVFRIESPAFYERLVPIIVVGFVAHHFIPRRWQLTAFAALSVFGIISVFGIVAGLWLVGIGAALIATCHLPIAFRWRVVLLIALGVALAFLRGGRIPVPWTGALWPILGSLFMFRLIAYMYDLRHQKEPVDWARTASYFFLLPNVAFPLFPVVDFSTFRRTHYDRPAIGIYQQGVDWMARGVTHLLLYRLVYQYATLSPSEVVDTASLVRYLLANFGLYLRVSGQFHLIVGILHLFGFRLPETHRFFYLAGSFTDFWRRINIYWKDFMMKVVFYPVHFRVKRWGDTFALVLGTLAVFVATWLTHSYQWFWLLGTWLMSATDTLFWGILAVLLVANSLRELRRGRPRALGAQAVSRRDAAGLALRTAATFAIICVLWSLWTARTVEDWWSMVRVVSFGARDVLWLLTPLAVVATAAFVTANRPRGQGPGWRLTALVSALPLGLAAAADRPAVAGYLGLTVREVVRDLRSAELNRSDAADLQRGYYENIVGVNRFNGQLWEVYSRTSKKLPSFNESGVLVASEGGTLQAELRPLVSVAYRGTTVRINRWGMRDRDYDSLPAPGTHRTAMLGQSYVMGRGVSDGETFETLFEDRLNREPPVSGPTQFEVLNFAVPDYSLLEQLHILENGRVAAFRPDLVLLIGHDMDMTRNVRYLVQQVRAGARIPWPEVRAVLDSAGVTRTTPWDDGLRRLAPYRTAVSRFALERLHRQISDLGVQAAYVMIPTPNPVVVGVQRDRSDDIMQMAEAVGIDVIDMRTVYDGTPIETLWVAGEDKHPNAAGHRMIAERLYVEVVRRPALFARLAVP